MVNIYTIVIDNQSGKPQDYALFNEAPKVTGKVQAQIFSNVFANATTPDGATSKFTMTNHYYAVVGSSDGAPGDQVTVNVSKSQEVTLGTKADDGTVIKGTTFALEIIEVNSKKAPTFGKAALENGSNEGAFEIRTPSFELADAQKGNWLIGLGAAEKGAGLKNPAATFVPEPLVSYQIQPSIKYTVTPAQYEEGAIIDLTKIGASVDVDFKNYPTGVVKVVHTSNGKLTIQK